jgi:DNA invertase Pin-like site-specific DNA recombinase
MTSPVAYIRRSVARTGDPGDISREFQTAKVRALANGDGDSLRIIDGDWGRSAGRHKADLRAAFRALLADIEAGKVSTLYAYSTDRLARDAESAYGLLNAAERAGTTIVTSEGRFPPGDRMARQMFGFQAMQNEAALDNMSDKAASTAVRRQERGDRMGRAPYGYRHEMIDGVSTLVQRDDEDPMAVVAAFKEAGSYNGAAKLLNAQAGQTVTAEDGSVIGTGAGLPTRFGRQWDASTVRHIVMKHAPDLIPVTRHRGSAALSVGGRKPARFARLLLCPHANLHKPAGNRPFLTAGTSPSYTRKDGTVAKYPVRYYCAVAHTDAMHPRPYIVAEAKVIAWAREALQDVGRRYAVEMTGPEPAVEAKLADLEAQRDRVWTMVRELGYPMDRAKADVARIDAEMPALELGSRAVSLLSRLPAYGPGIDLDGDSGEVNAALRNLWEYVELDSRTASEGGTFEPVRAVWTIGNEPPHDAVGDASEDVGQ